MDEKTKDELVEAVAALLWRQTPHGDTADLADLPKELQAEFRRRAGNVLRHLRAEGYRIEEPESTTKVPTDERLEEILAEARQTPLVKVEADEEREAQLVQMLENAHTNHIWATDGTKFIHIKDVAKFIAAREAALRAEGPAERLCSQCGEQMSVMVKVGTSDGWCGSCLDEAADHSGCEAAARADIRARLVEKIRAECLGADFGRYPDGRESPDAALHHAYDEGLQRAAEMVADLLGSEAES